MIDKHNPEEIDHLIRESLSEEEAAYYFDLEEQGLIEQLTSLFHGKMKWLNISLMLISLVFVAIAVYCLMEFLAATETQSLIRWGAGMFAAIIMQSMLKLYSWNQMDKNTLLREMKRLEYQISLLKKQD